MSLCLEQLAYECDCERISIRVIRHGGPHWTPRNFSHFWGKRDADRSCAAATLYSIYLTGITHGAAEEPAFLETRAHSPTLNIRVPGCPARNPSTHLCPLVPGSADPGRLASSTHHLSFRDQPRNLKTGRTESKAGVRRRKDERRRAREVGIKTIFLIKVLVGF